MNVISVTEKEPTQLIHPPIPENEIGRLAALHQYDILDTVPDIAFDDLTCLAAQICGTPMALVSLIDADRQWFKSKVGVTATETPRDIAFCAHGILQDDLMVVPDALADDRFADSPLVTSDPHVRFYAGAPLVNAEGHALGMLCVKDTKPRDLTPDQADALRILGRQVMTQLELRRHIGELRATITELQQAHAAREAAQTLLTAIVEHLPHMIFVKEAQDLCFVRWNAAGEAILGIERDDILGKNDYDLFPPDQAAAFVAKDREVFAAGQLVDIPEEPIQTPHQGTRLLHTKKIPLYDPAGRPQYLLGISEDITTRKQGEDERAQLQAEIIRVQAAALDELSTPMIPITDRVMVMPLIGAIDSRRAQQIIETLLHGVSANQTQMVILDITGVSVVDTDVANGIVRAAQAVRLLGAEVVLTGIRPEVAQTLVELGVDLRTIKTRSRLQDGIAIALTSSGSAERMRTHVLF